MTTRSPFKPHYGSNQVVTPAAAAASITLNAVDKSVRVVNTGAAIGYFKIGIAADITAKPATTADCAVASGASIVVEKSDGADTLSHISATGTTFQVMTGEGGI